MKQIGQIISEVKKNNFLKDEIIDENSRHVKDAIAFYKKYPQYEALEANAVFYIKMARGSVSVREFDNKSLWFVGNILGQSQAPIASIGTWNSISGWEEDLKKHSKIIDSISL